ncbi:hypothetical protein CLAFUW4_10641 [Fulvia fulva]|uniref:MYND-type domain-containing protein n=1 Tax=Passalora fulva TaxID=5499 RepID=A0A9Q8LGI5_PASFU|nr:uncharacterized protein CLAFUR5_05254 [Fulvia fulva]KAK4616208.1 hypothetical protein CLAFUR4_10646 [Fulvia fulva]KAK4616957.1 hypothetical protein CLAFUR0_10598 [Fulvia fulva]UJO17032.1 hypothetical protein CLAFUR5_05254 [Fulvia fulva]WPV19374.1 hypothetical protein CLAFUW4_10641 [Fulvia fulva]WPV33968.1 hypothetical protein CLAFUW7_10643 [Fulvia fulva]
MSSSPNAQTVPTLLISRDGKTIQYGRIPLADFLDSSKWDLSPISKSLGLPLKANGNASDLSTASNKDEHIYANAFFINYDPYSSGFGKPVRAPYVGEHVILARCDGLPIDDMVVTAMHGHFTALTCDGKCGSKYVCKCPGDSALSKKAIANACTKKTFSAMLDQALGMMATMPGVGKIENPLNEKEQEGAMPFCGGCGMARKEDGGELMKCAKCSKAVYCGRKCQKGEWREHKTVCKEEEKA